MMFTIGINAYNASPFIEKTLASVFVQTVSDFEVVVVDDGSTDNTVDLLKKITDPRLRIVRQENKGIAEALNRTITEAKGEWLVHLDADDVCYPHRLARVAEAIRKNPQAGLFYSRADYFNKQGCFGSFRTTEASPHALRAITQSGYLLAICHSTSVFNVEKLKALGGYTYKDIATDSDMWARLTLEHDAVFIPEKLVGMRIHEDSTTHQKRLRQSINALYIQYRLLSRLWNWQAQPYENVAPLLESLIDKSDFMAKDYSRLMAIRMAQRRFYEAAGYGLKSFIASPTFFINRAICELGKSNQPVVNGIDPHQFAQRAKSLWSG